MPITSSSARRHVERKWARPAPLPRRAARAPAAAHGVAGRRSPSRITSHLRASVLAVAGRQTLGWGLLESTCVLPACTGRRLEHGHARRKRARTSSPRAARFTHRTGGWIGGRRGTWFCPMLFGAGSNLCSCSFALV